MNRKAVIDIGTNSVKFLLAEMGADGVLRTVMDRNNIARLGEGLRETGTISQEAITRNAQAVAEFVAMARQGGADQIAVVGTMALRTASNPQDFIKAVKDLAGIEVRILSGDEEAYLAYLAAVSGIVLGQGRLAIIDIGGGSTEFVFGRGDKLHTRFSINLGVVGITEEFFKSNPVTKGELARAMEAIAELLEANGVSGPVDQLVGMGGTVTSMGAVMHKMETYDPDVVQGSEMSLEEINRQIDIYSSMTVEDRRKVTGLHPKRADVILAGACILKSIVLRFGTDRLTVSDRGLRHGLMHVCFGSRA
ncbi:MAG: Ppx/GppA family phosphatase [Firmicutes bacterium]|jgi:exopolyphosphatase/guanosine-5'-triphosphate,3'-diphosphate pyrophosphatase|nr:Ppx/GppA family phosphatase [Bacillota bacterium]